MKEAMPEARESEERGEILVTDRPEAIVMAASRRALAPTPHIGLLSGQELLGQLGQEIEVVDPSWQGVLETPIGKINISFAEPTPKSIVEAPIQTQVSTLVKGAAAIEAAKEVLPQQKSFLKRVEDKMLAATGELLKGKTRKATVAATMLALASACTPRVSPTAETPIASPTQPRITEVSPTPTQEPTATNTPEPTPTMEPSPTPEGWVSEEKINELAQKLICTQGTCVQESWFSGYEGKMFAMDIISTGQIKSVDLIDGRTEKAVGKMDLVVAITKDANGKPKLIYMVAQAMLDSNPEFNLNAPMLFLQTWLQPLEVTQNATVLNNKPQAREFLENAYKEGRAFEISVPKTGNIPDRLDPQYGKLFDYIFSSQKYRVRIENFAAKKGADEDSEPLIVTIISSSNL